MVGKLSDDTKMSGSRIPVLYCWKRGIPHPWSTPNDELRRSIDAFYGELPESNIGEPGMVGNLLEPALVESACEELGLPRPTLTPDVYKTDDFECSCDGLVELDEPVIVRAGGIVSIAGGLREVALPPRLPIECKVTIAPPTDEPPLYRGPIQLQAQMMATNSAAGILVTLHRGIERRIVIYPADADIQSEIAVLCADFKRRVAEEDWFPPVSVEDAAIPPADESSEPVELAGLDNDVYQLEMLRADRAELDERIEALQVKIMAALGDATKGIAGPYQVEWPVRHYKAQPERIVPAKDARVTRLKTLKVRSIV
jgi:hypothetical protein